jgi:hypothetical protein
MKFNAVKVGSKIQIPGSRIAETVTCTCGDAYQILAPSNMKTLPSELLVMLRKNLVSRGGTKHVEIVHLNF